MSKYIHKEDDNFIEESGDLSMGNYKVLEENIIALYEGNQFLETKFLIKIKPRYRDNDRNLNIMSRSNE